ncbi:hypothetical protein QYE76_036800 [Lolium multiflorum]|uniref:Ubiquitin-like domain-containing protein n=1 Tax=Lolium multiflorum TaxID=4521 RepID=A0AAD8VME4_LOLMU|nr:hypothetical protein QYE76_036800 [Lolium multiflorum]
MASEVIEEQEKAKKMTIFVTVPKPRCRYTHDALKVAAIEVSRDDTVASVKATLHTMEGIHPRRQRLVFACSALPDDDDTTLADHGVVDSATIQLVETKMEVFVRCCWTGRPILLSGVESCDTVESFRLRLQEREEIRLRPKRQKIIYCSVNLEDGHTLADYGVRDGTTVTLVPRPVGMRHRVVELDIEATDTVGRIKEMVEVGCQVEEEEGVPVACQNNVYYCGEELDDGHPMALHGHALDWVNIVCRRQEKKDATKTCYKGDPTGVKTKRRAKVEVSGLLGKKIKTLAEIRLSAILTGPELEAICPSSCDTDPAG